MQTFEYSKRPFGPTLFDRISEKLFEALPEEGLELLIVDKEENLHFCQGAKYAKDRVDHRLIERILTLISDSDEPVITQADDCGIVATALAKDAADYGCLIFVLPQYTPDATIANINLLDIILNQAALIADIIEQDHFRPRCALSSLHSPDRIAFN